MKDFYDVYVLLKNNKIENNNLQLAILQTFKHRNINFIENHSLFSDGFINDETRQTMWKAFLRKIKHPGNLDFAVVVKMIVENLHPIYLELRNNTN